MKPFVACLLLAICAAGCGGAPTDVGNNIEEVEAASPEPNRPIYTHVENINDSELEN